MSDNDGYITDQLKHDLNHFTYSYMKGHTPTDSRIIEADESESTIHNTCYLNVYNNNLESHFINSNNQKCIQTSNKTSINNKT